MIRLSPETRRLKAKFEASKRADRKAAPKPEVVKRAPEDRQRFNRGRERDNTHLALVRLLPCFATMCRHRIELHGGDAAHVRYSSAAAGVLNPGVAVKPSDWRTLPASREEHREQHARGDEQAYWAALGVTDVYGVCRALYAVTGDLEAMRAVLRAAAAEAVRPRKVRVGA